MAEFQNLPVELKLVILGIVGPEQMLKMRLVSKRERDCIANYVSSLLSNPSSDFGLFDVRGQKVRVTIEPTDPNYHTTMGRVLGAWINGTYRLNNNTSVQPGELVIRFDDYFIVRDSDPEKPIKEEIKRGLQNLNLNLLVQSIQAGLEHIEPELINRKNLDFYIRALLAAGRLRFKENFQGKWLENKYDGKWSKDEIVPISTPVNKAIALWSLELAYWVAPQQ